MTGIRPITMPKWGIEMQEGTITAWHRQPGDAVERGDELVDIETDKIVNTVESPAAGTLRRVLAAEGDVRSVGELIGVFASDDVSEPEIDRFIEGFSPADASFEPQEVGDAAPSDGGGAADSQPPEAQRISPIAKRVAKELGVDLSGVSGTGRKGRISKSDVEEAARVQGLLDDEPKGPAYEALKLTGTRRTAARRLQRAKQEIPHFYLQADVEAVALGKSADIAGVSVNVAVLKAMGMALAEIGEANVQLVDEELRRFEAVNVGIAVATDRGLVAPIVRDVAGAPLPELGERCSELVAKARSGRLSAEELDGGCSTVSNLGMLGVDRFAAIVNPPQTSILAVGRIIERPWAAGGEIVARPVLPVTLSCDHRAIDGALAARLLDAFRRAVASGLEESN